MALKNNENNKESKDRISTDRNISGNNLDSNNSERSRDLGETRGLNAEQNAIEDFRGSETPPISEPGSPEIKVSKRRHRYSRSEDSEGDLLSSLNINMNDLLGLAGIVVGGTLLYKGLKGGWPFSNKISKIDINTKQKVKRSREELYTYWRNLENLPHFMSHLEEVEEINDRRSFWTAEIPGGLGTIEWEARITEEEENEYLSWKSLPNSEIKNSGEVTFRDAPDGKGTIVETTISYHPPAGKPGDYVAKLLNPAFEKIVKRDLKQFKKHMEGRHMEGSLKSRSRNDLY